MIRKTYIEPAILKKIVRGKKIFIWGARHEGYAAGLVLKRIGIQQTGFIDSSLSLKGRSAFGYPILLPETFFAEYPVENAFIIIASGFYADEIAQICRDNSFQRMKNYLIYGELRNFNYQIDVSGSCNLKCISCPRGNFPNHRRPGFMTPATFEKLIRKIITDDPYTGIISLYNWGEPLLNKALPEIIEVTHRHSLLSALSSNLSFNIDFEPVIKARPTWFRISNSGWGKNYEITHTGAQWELFYDNLLKLKTYQEKHHPEMIVELFFHIYNHNRDDYLKMKALCDSLGFTIRYRHAALAPLDNIQKIMDNEQISIQAGKTRELQLLKVEDAITIAQSEDEKNRPCYYEDHLWIDWDLSVAHCMEWYKPALNLVEKDFLSVSIQELIQARENSAFCKKCKAKGIHRVFCVYGDEKRISLEPPLKEQL
jgi:MoaA/NifB/PqqE/SkfB family radical SAM enzyme